MTMAFEVRVPPLGESVTEGVIVRWAKQDGERVQRDEILLELETDKASMELPAETTGVLRILRPVGATVTVGEVVGRIEESGGREAEGLASPAQSAETLATAVVPEAPIGAAELVGEPIDRGVRENASPPTGAVGPISPAVRRLLEEHGLDPTAIATSGRGGRLTKGDVLAYIERGPREGASESERVASAPVERGPDGGSVPVERRSSGGGASLNVAVTSEGELKEGEEAAPMSRLRKRIAERLVQAQQTAAILTTFNEIDMSAVMALRAEHKERFQKTHGIGLGFMSFFARACVAALREIPAINSEIRGDAIISRRFVHLGIAVGTTRGLVVPVVHHAERRSFAEIEGEIVRLAARAHEGKLTIEDLAGGTFTISNGGVYGSLLSTPILNPPQSGILGMHKIEKRAVVVDDQIVIRPMMYVALSYDHRIVDGEQAVTFLVRVKERVEDPTRLLLEV